MGQKQTETRYTREVPFESTDNLKIEPIQIDKDTVDAGNSPTTRLRPGLVLQEQTSGKYSHVGAANPKAAAPAVALSLVAVIAQLASGTVTVRDSKGNVVDVVLDAADDTLAEVVTRLNNNAEFSDKFIAADNGAGLLQITARNELDSIEVTSSVAAVFGASGVTANPIIPKFVVLIDFEYSMRNSLTEAVEDQDKAGAFGGGIIQRGKLLGSNMQAEAFFRSNGMVIRN